MMYVHIYRLYKCVSDNNVISHSKQIKAQKIYDYFLGGLTVCKIIHRASAVEKENKHTYTIHI